MIQIYSLSYCCTYKKTKKKRYINQKERAANRAKSQPSSEYICVRMRIILILYFLSNIIRVAKYEYDVYFKL